MIEKIRKCVAYAPALVLLAGMLIFYFTDFSRFFTFETIQQQHGLWVTYVKTHPVLSAFYFVVIYVLSVYFVIPDSIILSILGGLLFPLPLAILYIAFSETFGAVLFFLTAEMTYKQLYQKWHPLDYLPKFFKKKLKDDHYKAPLLLFFRLSHLLPFWVINVCAAFMNVSVKTFTWTTLIGVLPLAAVLALGGSHLNRYMATHTEFSIFTFLDTPTKICLVLIGLIALIPLFLKKH